MKRATLNILVALMSMFLSNYSIGQCKESVQQVLNIANEEIKIKKYDEALKILEKAETIDKSCGGVHLLKALCYSEFKDFVKAEQEIAIAHRLNPNSKSNEYYLIKIKVKEGKLNDAYKLLESCIQRDTTLQNRVYWLSMRADIKSQVRDYKGAYEDNSQIYLIQPSNHRLAMLIMHELHNNLQGKAEAHLNELLNRKEKIDTLKYFYDLGIIYQLKKEYDKSSACFQAILVKYPANAVSYMCIGLNFAYLNNKTAAFDNINKAIELGKGDALILNNKGFIEILFKQYDEAIIDLNKAIDLNKELPEPYNNLGYIYNQRGGEENLKLAKMYFNKAKEVGGEQYQPYWKY